MYLRHPPGKCPLRILIPSMFSLVGLTLFVRLQKQLGDFSVRREHLPPKAHARQRKQRIRSWNQRRILPYNIISSGENLAPAVQEKLKRAKTDAKPVVKIFPFSTGVRICSNGDLPD